MARVKLSMNKVQSSMSTTEMGTMPNNTRTCRELKGASRRNFLSMCRAAVWLCVGWASFCFSKRMRWLHAERISVLLTKLSLASISRKHRTVYIRIEETPSNTCHLYVGIVQISTFVVVAVKKSSSGK